LKFSYKTVKIYEEKSVVTDQPNGIWQVVFMRIPKGKKVAVICLCLCVAVAAIIVTDVFLSAREYQGSTALMNTVVSLNVEGKSAEDTAESIKNRIAELENASLSRYRAASSVSKINAGAGDFCHTDALILELSQRCSELLKKSGGAFNPLLGKVSDLWGFRTQDARVPNSDELEKALTAVRQKNIETDTQKVKIPEGTVMDFGAVGKGVACDEARKVLQKTETKRAVISVGGSVLLYGEGQSFSVGVRNPLGGPADCVGTLTLNETCISTSGSYENSFTSDGKTYHHILNPETGYPVENDLLSVTVVCKDGFLSDALSTACFVLGYERSLDLLKEYDAHALFVFKDKSIRITEGLSEKFELSDDSFTILNGDI